MLPRVVEPRRNGRDDLCQRVDSQSFERLARLRGQGTHRTLAEIGFEDRLRQRSRGTSDANLDPGHPARHRENADHERERHNVDAARQQPTAHA